MHGNEPHTRRILETLRDGRPVRGVDLWVLPTYNPDGLARGTRRNARGVDLNRNFPHLWKDLDGTYESGPRPASEPETRAVMAFLEEVDPRRVISFHQPLHGVDTDTKDAGFAPAPGACAAAAPHRPRLRRAVPRHHDDVVQPPLPRVGAHRRVRRPPLAAPDGGPGARQLLGVIGAHRAGRG